MEQALNHCADRDTRISWRNFRKFPTSIRTRARKFIISQIVESEIIWNPSFVPEIIPDKDSDTKVFYTYSRHQFGL